jgi:hypothetical protein
MGIIELSTDLFLYYIENRIHYMCRPVMFICRWKQTTEIQSWREVTSIEK